MTMPKFGPFAWVIECNDGKTTLFYGAKRPLGFDTWPNTKVVAAHTADQLTEAYEAGKMEQAAQIEMMREALSKIEYLESANGCIMSAGDCSSVATEALSATPDEALEQFAAKVREQCAKLCDDLVSDYPSRTDITATQCADAIRAIKELP